MSETLEVSVAISDAALFVTSFMSAFLLWDKSECLVDAISFGVIGLAALSGTIRFGIYPKFIIVHQPLAKIAAYGVAMISLSIWTFNDGDSGQYKNILCSILK